MSDKLLQDSSSSDTSEEEDEDAKELTEDVEKTFFKTLSYIKKKDPTIYDEKVNFFSKDDSEKSQDNKSKKKKKVTPLNLRAYERKLIVERGGELSDEEFIDDEDRPRSPTYTEEQRELKESFKRVLSDDVDNDEDTWGGLFIKREKTVTEVKQEDKEYFEWLKGRKNDLSDKEVKEDLKYLHDYWTDPKLDKGEQFLRDYILNKRFLEKDDEPEVDLDKLLEEEKELEEQTEFEHKYNYRFEEPDQEFIKRYPRTMANSLRVKDDRRKEKRDEVKERKTKEKEKKKEEIKKKKKLKKQEIETKLEELKKLTGNDQLAFENHLNTDFDQDEYDRTMMRLFNEEFYSQQDHNFNPKDAMDEDYNGPWDDDGYTNNEEGNDDVNCEDPNFVMDCDYDPTKVSKKSKKEGKGRRARDKHRRTTVSEAVSREKPAFDPTQHYSFQDYLDQYYGIDCEDFIGDQPCRFKYKRITPNNYGLTVEEILTADDKELERWCSMKRVHKVGSEHKEKNDAKMYSKKAKNDEIKMKILPSLYLESAEKDINEDNNKVKKKKKKRKKDNVSVDGTTNNVLVKEDNEDRLKENQIENNKCSTQEDGMEHLNHNEKVVKEKVKKIKRINKQIINDKGNSFIIENKIDNKLCLPHVDAIEQFNHNKEVRDEKINKIKDKHTNKSKKKKENQINDKSSTQNDNGSKEVSSTKKMKKIKSKQENDFGDNKSFKTQNETNMEVKLDNVNNNEETENKSAVKVTSNKKEKRKQNNSNLNINGLDISKSEGKSRRQKRNEKSKLLNMKKKKSHKYNETFKIADKYEKNLMKANTFKIKKNNNKVSISDSRLMAYGIKPKVFNDKLKYGTQFSKYLDEDF